MSALARWCYQHRFVVITVWVGLLIGLAVMSQAVKTKTDNSLTLPGTNSNSAQELLQRSGSAQAGDADQIVWQVYPGGSVTDPAVEQRISAMLTQVSHLPEVASVASPYVPGGEVQLSSDRRTAYATVNFTKQADNLDHTDVNQVISTATLAPVIRSSAAAEVWNTWLGEPAAAQTGSSASRSSSSSSSGALRCPTGATPPIANPVTWRTQSASARPSFTSSAASAFA